MMMIIDEGDCLLMVSAVFLVYMFNKSEKWYEQLFTWFLISGTYQVLGRT